MKLPLTQTSAKFTEAAACQRDVVHMAQGTELHTVVSTTAFEL